MVGASLAVSVFIAIAAAELFWPARVATAPMGRRWFGNVTLYLLTNALFMLPTVAAFMAAIGAEAAGSGALAWLGLPPLLHAAIAIVGLDVFNYISHRLSHLVGPLWRLHAVHHSDADIDVTTALRHHPGEALVMAALLGATVFVMGFTPAEVALYAALEWSVQALAHANLAIPSRLDTVLRRIIVTPGFHQLHHSRRVAETNSNYGQVFTVWDALFGTARRARPEPIEFGLDAFRDARSQDPHWLLAQPLRRQAPPRDYAAGTTRNRSVSPVS